MANLTWFIALFLSLKAPIQTLYKTSLATASNPNKSIKLSLITRATALILLLTFKSLSALTLEIKQQNESKKKYE